jgi:transposase
MVTMPSSTPRTYTITEQRRVMNLYASGLSTKQTAERTGVPVITVYGWLKRADRVRSRSAAQQLHRSGAEWYDDATVERIRALYHQGLGVPAIAKRLSVTRVKLTSLMRNAGILGTRSQGTARRHNSPHTRAGARRIALIREAVRLEREGWTQTRIGEALGIMQPHVSRLLRSPYAEALRVFTHGTGATKRKPYAVAMHERQGLPSWFIAKALDVPTATVDAWLASEDRHRASKRASEQRRRDRATAEFIDAHRDADTRPQPE